MKEVALADAKNRLSALVQEVEDTGEDIIITKHGRPAVRLTRPVRRPRTLEDQKKFAEEMSRLRDEQARLAPESAKPIPWETLKGWMYPEDAGSAE